jgi:hypothetical protein
MTDDLLQSITAAVELGRSGNRDEARRRLTELWDESAADAFHRCTLAHYLADLQPSTEEELVWDLRALDEARQLTDGRVQQVHESLQVRGFLPSLHLNLADDYRRLGRFGEAAAQLDAARVWLDALADDGYGDLVRGGVDRVAKALAAGSTATIPSNPA